MGKEPKASVPKEAQVMAAILKDMNVTEYEPGVVNQMLEFTYREYPPTPCLQTEFLSLEFRVDFPFHDSLHS